MDGLEKAISIAGGQKGLAERLGCSSMAITQWKRRGVPADRVLPLFWVTSGEVSPHEIRPDIYPDPNWTPSLDAPWWPEVLDAAGIRFERAA